MFIIKLADINIKINNNYQFLNNLCHDYILDSNDYEIEISISEEDIDKELENCEIKYSRGYIESLSCYRKISMELLKHNCFLMHAAVIEVNSRGYAFLARSGTGKTTHTKLWQKLLGNKMKYVNGDKPLIRLINGIPYAYGTPWCGKEGFGENSRVELNSLCFIERGLENSIIELPKKDVLSRVIHQILIPNDEFMAIKTIDLLNKTIIYTDSYLLKCNMDIEAAEVAYNKMKK